jgi:hypothetical protein
MYYACHSSDNAALFKIVIVANGSYILILGMCFLVSSRVLHVDNCGDTMFHYAVSWQQSAHTLMQSSDADCNC